MCSRSTFLVSCYLISCWCSRSIGSFDVLFCFKTRPGNRWLATSVFLPFNAPTHLALHFRVNSFISNRTTTFGKAISRCSLFSCHLRIIVTLSHLLTLLFLHEANMSGDSSDQSEPISNPLSPRTPNFEELLLDVNRLIGRLRNMEEALAKNDDELEYAKLRKEHIDIDRKYIEISCILANANPEAVPAGEIALKTIIVDVLDAREKLRTILDETTDSLYDASHRFSDNNKGTDNPRPHSAEESSTGARIPETQPAAYIEGNTAGAVTVSPNNIFTDAARDALPGGDNPALDRALRDEAADMSRRAQDLGPSHAQGIPAGGDGTALSRGDVAVGDVLTVVDVGGGNVELRQVEKDKAEGQVGCKSREAGGGQCDNQDDICEGGPYCKSK